MAAISGESRSASIISKGRSVIKRFPGDKLTEIITKHPKVAQRLFGLIASRLDNANKINIKLINDLQKARTK